MPLFIHGFGSQSSISIRRGHRQIIKAYHPLSICIFLDIKLFSIYNDIITYLTVSAFESSRTVACIHRNAIFAFTIVLTWIRIAVIDICGEKITKKFASIFCKIIIETKVRFSVGKLPNQNNWTYLFRSPSQSILHRTRMCNR